MNEARNNSKFLGRDHHPRAFTMWLAGGGIKRGALVGATDELGYNAVEDPSTSTTCTPRCCTSWASTTTKLTYSIQGRQFRLTDVSGNVVTKLLA